GRMHHAYRYEAMHRDLLKMGPRGRVFGPMVNVLPFPQATAFGPLTAEKEVICAGPVADCSLALFYASPKIPPLCEFVGHPEAMPEGDLQAVCDDWRVLLEQAFGHPSEPLSALLEKRWARLRAEQTLVADETVMSEGTVLHPIRRIVAETPMRIAIECEGRPAITYEAMWRASEQAANALRERGVARGAYVGVMMDRSPEAIQAIIAIMMAGGCY